MTAHVPAWLLVWVGRVKISSAIFLCCPRHPGLWDLWGLGLQLLMYGFFSFLRQAPAAIKNREDSLLQLIPAARDGCETRYTRPTCIYAARHHVISKNLISTPE